MTSTALSVTTTIYSFPTLCRLHCTILFSVLLAGVSSANIFLPAGLSPGDNYRIAFVTSTFRDALSTDINDYNTHVNSAANAIGTVTQPLNTTWTAIGSTNAVDARDNTNTNPSSTGVPIYLVDGTTQIAANNADLWNGSISDELRLNEYGNNPGSVFVWTGTDPNGTASGIGAYLGNPGPGVLGHTDYSNSVNNFNNFWIAFGTTGTLNASFFYGISDVLTARVVPEPHALVCLGSAIIAILGARRTQRRCPWS